jgi:hypothetical protein
LKGKAVACDKNVQINKITLLVKQTTKELVEKYNK